MKITRKPIAYNFSSRNGVKIEYIVIHDTGNPRAGADAMNHFRYFNGGNRSASAHYFVDDKEVVQTVPDHLASWHCGDGSGKYGIANSNSIGIEMCINADGDYEAAYRKTVELTKHLMEVHKIPASKVVRHYDASKKRCPGTWASNDWERWKAFQNEIRGNHVEVKPPSEAETYDGTVTASVLNVRLGPGMEHEVVRTLNRGDKVKINSQHGDWLEIDHGKWVAAEYIKILRGESVAEKKDDPSKWHQEAWEWAIKEQITDGTEPKRAATREEVVTMIRRAIGPQEQSKPEPEKIKEAPGIAEPKVKQYQVGPLQIIEGPASKVEPRRINKPLHEEKRNGINGTFYDNNGSVMILLKDGEVLGNNAYWNGWECPPRPIFYHAGDYTYHDMVTNIYEAKAPIKRIKWAVGGGSLPFKDTEKWGGDVTRKAERAGMAFKDDKVYLIVTKEQLTLPEFSKLIYAHLDVEKAMFLDGGGSVQMYFNGPIIKSTRAVDNGIFFKE